MRIIIQNYKYSIENGEMLKKLLFSTSELRFKDICIFIFVTLGGISWDDDITSIDKKLSK